MNSIKVNWKIT